MNVAMTSQFGLNLLVLKHLIFLSQLKGLFCNPIQSHIEDTRRSTLHAATPTALDTIFDSRVLNTVKTLYSRSIVRDAKLTREKTGRKKSIIETADTVLHVKIDPSQFGQTLLNKAGENANAARKSDIYMDKAIDATALGVAVLKLIFGKDAKMIMKDSKDSDVKASLRANEFRPGITSWSTPQQEAAGERKSLSKDDSTSNPVRKSDKVAQLNLNILKLVKNLQPVPSHNDKSKEGEKGTVNSESVGRVDTKKSTSRRLTDSENNLARLLSLIKENESSARPQKGEKKSWVLLKVPRKQPQDELGMLSDPIKTEESASDDSNHEENHRRIMQQQQYPTIEHKQQSSEGKSLTKITSSFSKNLKSEPVQEVNAVKTDTTTHIHYGESVKNLLKALQTTHQHAAGHTPKHFVDDDKTSGPLHNERVKLVSSKQIEQNTVSKDELSNSANREESVNNLLKALETTHRQAAGHTPKHFVDDDKSSGPLHKERVKLVPSKTIEQNAASKDELSNSANPGSAVVSLDALRQLGQLLGLSAPHSESKISPYTGTKDTLTFATALPPQAAQALANTAPPTPRPTTPPPAPKEATESSLQNPENGTPAPAPKETTESSLKNSENQRAMSLSRISEQLKMFAERGLRGHNEYRHLHHAEPLKWSEDLASAAEKLAYQAAKKGATTRSELVAKKGYGENVAKISNIALENAGEEATRHWYNERENFTFSDPSIVDATQAFTQVIWKGTKTLGMGAAKDDDTGELYVIALYYPIGNDEGALRENIQSDGKEHIDVYASIFKKSTPVRHEQE